MDLAFATGLAAFLGYFWVAEDNFMAATAQGIRTTFAAAPQVLGEEGALFPLIRMLFAAAARPIAIMAAAMFLVVLLFELVQTGVIFTTQPLKPDFSRINPAQGFKRIFSWQMMLNAAKNIFKLVMYGVVAWLTIKDSFLEFAPTIVDGRTLAIALGQASARLLLYFLGVGLCFAAIDQLLVRRAFAKQMRMSRRDVRRESRDREGDPRMKQRRKGLHGEFVRNSKSLRNMPSADMLIVNPVHYAVGLKYDGDKMAAPLVVAQGVHSFALRLKKMAMVYGVPVIEDPELARNLYKLAFEKPIAEVYFTAVAKHYRTQRAAAAKASAPDGQ